MRLTAARRCGSLGSGEKASTGASVPVPGPVAQQHTILALAITQPQHAEVLHRVAEGQQKIVTLLTELIDRDERRGDTVGGE